MGWRDCGRTWEGRYNIRYGVLEEEININLADYICNVLKCMIKMDKAYPNLRINN